MNNREWLEENGFVMTRKVINHGEVEFHDLDDSAVIYYRKDGLCYGSVKALFREDANGCYPNHFVAADAADAVKVAGRMISSELWKMSDELCDHGPSIEFAEVAGEAEAHDRTVRSDDRTLVADFGPFKMSASTREFCFGRTYNLVSKSNLVNLQVIVVADREWTKALKKITEAVDELIMDVNYLFGQRD